MVTPPALCSETGASSPACGGALSLWAKGRRDNRVGLVLSQTAFWKVRGSVGGRTKFWDFLDETISQNRWPLSGFMDGQVTSGALGKGTPVPTAAGRRALTGGVVSTAGPASELRATGGGPLGLLSPVYLTADTPSDGSISRGSVPFKVVGSGFKLSRPTNIPPKERQGRFGFYVPAPHSILGLYRLWSPRETCK